MAALASASSTRSRESTAPNSAGVVGDDFGSGGDPESGHANITKRKLASDSEDSLEGKEEKRAGRRKIKIEYIEDKSRRHITFSKRKAGIMKKAYELSTLTGTQVLLLVVSETGLVYTFTTPKLQPLVTKPEGKNLIQACLNAPDTPQGGNENAGSPTHAAGAYNTVDQQAAQSIEHNSADNTGLATSITASQPVQAQPMGQPTSYAALYNQSYGMPLNAAAAAAAGFMNSPQYYAQSPTSAQMNPYAANAAAAAVQSSYLQQQQQASYWAPATSQQAQVRPTQVPSYPDKK